MHIGLFRVAPRVQRFYKNLSAIREALVKKLVSGWPYPALRRKSPRASSKRVRFPPVLRVASSRATMSPPATAISGENVGQKIHLSQWKEKRNNLKAIQYYTPGTTPVTPTYFRVIHCYYNCSVTYPRFDFALAAAKNGLHPHVCIGARDLLDNQIHTKQQRGRAQT